MLVRSLALLMMVEVACGSVSVSMNGDGGPGEIDAAPGIATAVVVDRLARPAANLHVVFQGPDGTLIGDMLTSADGTASATVPSGSTFTVLTMTLDGPRAITVMGIEAGDRVTVPVPSDPPAMVGNLTISFPTTIPSGVTSVRYTIGCSEGGLTISGSVPTPQTLQLREDCFRGGDLVSVLALALDSNSNAVAYAIATDVTLSGQSPTLSGSVTLSSWQTDFAGLDLTLTNVPAGTTLLDPEFRPFRHGLGFDAVDNAAEIMDPQASTAVTFRYVPNFASHVQYSTFAVSGSDPATAGARIWGKMARTPPQSDTGDLSMLLPRLTGASAVSEGATVRVIWQSETPITDADGAFVLVGWDVSGMSMTGNWAVLAPPDLPGEVSLPQLPADYAAWAPPTAINAPVVVFVELSLVNGYREMRNTIGPGLFGESEGLPAGDYSFRASFSGLFN